MAFYFIIFYFFFFFVFGIYFIFWFYYLFNTTKMIFASQKNTNQWICMHCLINMCDFALFSSSSSFSSVVVVLLRGISSGLSSVPQSYVYGSPYQSAGLVPLHSTPSQLTHAAALAAATNQFYEYQVNVQSTFTFMSHSIVVFFLTH